MAAKKYTTAPVVWGASTLENIGKENYSGVAEAMRSTGYNGKKLVKK